MKGVIALSNPALNNLLREYEQKKYRAELAFEKEKQEFYSTHPELEALNVKLGKIALDISKAILQQNNNLADKLKTEYQILEKEKQEMLDSLNIPIRRSKTYI